ncbi:four helix bundle protein [Patescibacteria group bacterium]|nr:four helix bundle protein [Patescibacteria group bacterium]MBU1910909.1 four helix bundle protein [Patescibacteria group bacterium]
MAFAKFEDIKAWQEARELNKRIHQICERAHIQRDQSWIDQITRASNSIMANIAEGNDSKSDVEFAKFLGYAKRSASEVRSHLYYTLDKNYISQEEFSVFSDRTNTITSQISNLIRYLYKSKRKIRSQG